MPQVSSADGTSIAYQTHGKGPLIILVSGATQYRGVDNASPKLAALLADRFTVLIYDRRGRGESGNIRPYAVGREIEDIEALIDAEGGTARLVGGSSGAVLALEAAAALPEKVLEVIAYEPPFDPHQTEETARADLAEQEGFAASGDGDAAMARFMESVGMPPEQIADFKASPGWAAFAAVGTTIAHDFRTMVEARFGGGLVQRWRGIAQPMLVVDGAASFPFMAAGAEMAAKAIPTAERLTLAGQGPDPEVFAPVIARFFG